MAEGTESADKDALLQSDQKPAEGNEGEKDSGDLHPRIQQLTKKMADLESTKDAEIAELREQLEEVKNAKKDSDQTEEQFTADQDAALDKIAKGLKRKGVLVTQEDLAEERRSRQYERLSEKHNGSDGYPKFVPVEVQAFAKRRGIGDLEDAYFIMNRTAISQVDARKLSKTPDAPDSEKPTGKTDKEAPGAKQVTPEDIANMTDEEYEQHRESLLRSMKPKPSL